MRRSFKGIKKTYWITCNVEPDIQQLPLDRRRYPSNFVVRPCDLNRLLANSWSSLQEITIIATECMILLMLQVNLVGNLSSFEATLILPSVQINFFFFNRIWRRMSWFRFWLQRRLFAAHSAVDRSCGRICAVCSLRQPSTRAFCRQRVEGISCIL
ncbi:uncharacterized protein LOC104415635 [Eucalyptus grandis]|uniref:uncharacterized protein LOC104415635 n=1 Tax=Eucalyptus grandis TaxID=71139 RepID=UPI00192E9E68|nr:uncharacterized protein LOC104415635 [Eucalyptus grandis]